MIAVQVLEPADELDQELSVSAQHEFVLEPLVARDLEVDARSSGPAVLWMWRMMKRFGKEMSIASSAACFSARTLHDRLQLDVGQEGTGRWSGPRYPGTGERTRAVSASGRLVDLAVGERAVHPLNRLVVETRRSRLGQA